MGRKWKTVTMVFVIFCLIFFVGVPMLFKGKMADIVKYEANKLLTAKLDFDDLDISLLQHFPNATLQIGGLSLTGGVEPFAGDTVVAADRIEVVVNLMSLFGDGGLEVTKVFLQHPVVQAEKTAEGQVNWDVMKPSADAADTADAVEEKTSEESFRMLIRDFRIEQARIRYRDDSVRMAFETDPLSLRLSGDLSAGQTDLKLKIGAERMSLVSGGVPLLHRTEAEIEAGIEADLENRRFTLSDNRFRLNSIELSMDGWIELVGQAVKMDLRAGCDKVMFKDVLSLIPAFYTRDFHDLSAGGSLAMSLWAKGELTDKTLPQFEFSTTVDQGSFRYSSLPKAVTDINLDLKVTNPGGRMDQTKVQVSKFTLALDDNRLQASLFATALASDPYVRAAVKGVVDLDAVKLVYPLQEGEELRGRITADLKLAGNLSSVERGRYERLDAGGQFVVEGVDLRLQNLPEVQVGRAAASISPESMTLGELNVKVGRSDLSANGQVSGYLGYLLRGDRLSGRLYVRSSLLDLNEFMTSADSAAVQEPVQEAAAEDPYADKPLSVIIVPKNLDLSLSTDLKSVVMQRMNLTDIAGEMTVKDGILSLNNLRVKAFDGSGRASGSYSTVHADSPEVKLSLSFADASFKKTFEQLDMVRRMVPIFEQTGGNYSLSASLSTRLDLHMSPVLNTLDASGEIRSENIEIRKLEAFEQMGRLVGNDRLGRIEARDVRIAFTIHDGRITTRPFDLNMGGVKINLSGSTGLDQTIDYVARVSLTKEHTIPVTIRGTFSKPKIGLGVGQAVEDALRDKAYDKINDLTGGKLPSGDVEQRAAQIREQAKKAGDKLVVAAQKQRQSMIDKTEGRKKFERKLAEKAGDKLVEEAEAQAARLMEEAERRIEKMKAE